MPPPDRAPPPPERIPLPLLRGADDPPLRPLEGARNDEPDDLDPDFGELIDGALPVLVAPELLGFTVDLVPEDDPTEVLPLVCERVVPMLLPVDVAPPLLMPDLVLVYPPSLRAAVELVPFRVAPPEVMPVEPREAVVDFVRVIDVPLAVVAMVREDFRTATPPFVVMPVTAAPPRYGFAFAEAYVALVAIPFVFAEA